MKVKLTKKAIEVIDMFGVRPFARLTQVKYQSIYTYKSNKSSPSFKNRKRILSGIKTIWITAEFNDVFEVI